MQVPLGCRQAARHGTLTPAFARFESCHPSHFDPLAQLVEHLTFNQGAWGSNPQWVTILLGLRVWRNGRRGRFRICCPQAYEFESLHPHLFLCGSSSVVECHLAKVDVASPNLVYRSISAPWPSGKAKLCKSFTLQFESGWRLHQGTQILIRYLGLFFCIFLRLRCKNKGSDS